MNNDIKDKKMLPLSSGGGKGLSGRATEKKTFFAASLTKSLFMLLQTKLKSSMNKLHKGTHLCEEVSKH